MVMAIQLIRTVTDRHSIATMYENPSHLGGHHWIHPTYNILRYEEGREAIGVGAHYQISRKLVQVPFMLKRLT